MLLFYFFVVYGASLANAFALYGGYERMFFYYAYLIDAHMAIDSGGKKPLTIARGCRGEMPCTFDQFVDYINDSTGLSISSDRHPDVDATAKALVDTGLSGVYQPSRILERISRQHPVPSLFKEVSFGPGYVSFWKVTNIFHSLDFQNFVLPRFSRSLR